MFMTLWTPWWVMIVRGALAVAFGLACLLWPDLVLETLVMLFGAFVLLNGLVALVAGFSLRGIGGPGFLFTEAAAGIALGLVLLFWPALPLYLLFLFVAFWAIAGGILEVVAGFRLRRHLPGEWGHVAFGILLVFFGVALLIWPLIAYAILGVGIGLYAILMGGAMILLTFRLRSAGGGLP